MICPSAYFLKNEKSLQLSIDKKNSQNRSFDAKTKKIKKLFTACNIILKQKKLKIKVQSFAVGVRNQKLKRISCPT